MCIAGKTRIAEVCKMIYLNTLSYENNPEEYRNNHHELFQTTVMNEELDKRAIEIIKEIDDAEYIGNNTMIDRFGNTTSIANLSTGAKVVLNIRWFIKHGKSSTPINITSCGDNVFHSLVEEVKHYDVYFLTCNYAILNRDKVDILVNNKYSVKCFSDLSSLGEKLYETSN